MQGRLPNSLERGLATFAGPGERDGTDNQNRARETARPTKGEVGRGALSLPVDGAVQGYSGLSARQADALDSSDRDQGDPEWRYPGIGSLKVICPLVLAEVAVCDQPAPFTSRPPRSNAELLVGPETRRNGACQESRSDRGDAG